MCPELANAARPSGHLQVKGPKGRRAWYALWRDADGRHQKRLGPAHVRDSGRRTPRGAVVWRAANGSKPNPSSFVALARDRRLGSARQMIIQGLGRTRDDRALAPLIDLLRDPEHEIDAMIGLGFLGHPDGARHIRPSLDDPDDTVRDEARQALGRLRHECRPRPAT
jgi:HEAT repeats